MTDPIADLLTRIRNGVRIQASSVRAPHSGMKKAILEVLKDGGFIRDWRSEIEGGKAVLVIDLKYGPDGEEVIRHIQRVSRPGRRVYRSVEDLPSPLNGLGLAIVSTSRGVISHQDAKKQNVGGEVLCEVW